MATPRQVGVFLELFCNWASVEVGLLAAALVGSYARRTATPGSDVDLVLIARQPQVYLEDTRWAATFGPVRQMQVEDYGKLKSLRVWYADELEVEYGITDENWAAIPVDEGTRQVVTGGFTVLFERRPLLSRLAASL